MEFYEDINYITSNYKINVGVLQNQEDGPFACLAGGNTK